MKTQHHCVESDFNPGLPPSLEKNVTVPLKPCLRHWVGDPSSVLLYQPQGTPHSSSRLPRSGTVTAGTWLTPWVSAPITGIFTLMEIHKLPHPAFSPCGRPRSCLQFSEDF